jgi:hypothetical protein
MKNLARIPFWLWLVMLSIFCYGIWNPIQGGKFSVVGLVLSDAALSIKALVSLLTFVILYFCINTARRTLGPGGMAIYAILIATVVWVLRDLGVNVDNPGVWSWVGPFLCALLLTIGLQGSKVYRAITGRVAVEDNDTVHPNEMDEQAHDHE